MTEELHYLPIAEAARRLARRELSPVELTEAFLARVAELDPVLHAFITVTEEAAMAAARAAEAEIVRGGPRGAMHGIPFGLKDIYDTRGVRTTAHSRLFESRIPDRDSACAQRLGEAGAVLIGKLATHEFATGGPAYDLPWPPARNPWRLDRFPGGSSSGAGAGVAAGLVPGALGSDTGGSIRLPAAFCGLAGLKPTYGRVSKRGVFPLSWTLDNCGPLAWTVEDCAILLAAIAGHDPLDPGSADVPVPDYLAGLEDGVAGVRIGVVRHFYERDRRASEATVGAMDEAIAVLEGLGARVQTVELPPLDDYQACYRMIVLAEAFAIHATDMRERLDRYASVTRYRILPGVAIGAADYLRALRFQETLAAATLAAFDGVDLLLSATTYGPAPVQATMQAEANFSLPPLTNPFNVAQLPAISICNGFSEEGLPLAMQIVARPFDEASVLRAARAFERATPWRDRRPTLAAGEPELPQPPAPAASLAAEPPRQGYYAELAARAGLRLDPHQIHDLAEAMVHVEEMRARIPEQACRPSGW